MSAPQIIMIAYLGFALGLELRDHGKPRTGTDNFWHALIAVGFLVGLLIWGGFFK